MITLTVIIGILMLYSMYKCIVTINDKNCRKNETAWNVLFFIVGLISWVVFILFCITFIIKAIINYLP